MSSSLAAKAGLVIGATYRVKGGNEHSWKPGQLCTFIHDDWTRQPRFAKVGGDKENYADTEYIYIENVELVETPKAEPVAVHVNLNGNSTTIVVQRNLTADEVAAVLKAIN